MPAWTASISTSSATPPPTGGCVEGGSDQGLMAVAGWSYRAMLDRYTISSAAERAAEEARGLNLGDLA